MEPQTEHLMLASPDEIADLKHQLSGFDVEIRDYEEPVEGFEPVTGIIIIGAGAAVAGALAYVAEVLRGGQVIDFQPGAKKTFYRSRDVQYGLIVIIPAEGPDKVRVELKEPRNYFNEVVKDLFGTLGKLAEKSIDAVKKTADAVVGDKGTVHVEPAS